MSEELLYNAVKSGRVKISDLNDAGRKALYNYLDRKTNTTEMRDAAQLAQQEQQEGYSEPVEYMTERDSQAMNAADNPDLWGNAPKFTENPLGYIVNKAPKLIGLPEGSLEKFSAALDAQLTPNAPYIRSTGLFSAEPVSGPTPYDEMISRRDHTGPSGTLGNVINTAGELTSFAAPIPGMNPILSEAYNNPLTQKVGQWAGNLVDNKLGSSVLQHAAQGTTAGALYGAAQPFVQGDGSLSDVPKSVAENALLFGLGDAALPLAGAGLKAAGQGLKTAGLAAKDALAGEPTGMRSAVNDFISKVDQTPSDLSAGRLVQQAEGSVPNTAQELANNFKRGEDYQKQYEQAINDQYNYLKQSMENRAGIEQGGVIRDPVTGEVVDRYGSVSNNPDWYQQFYKENGRAPTDKDLRELAKKHVNEGFQSEVGLVPPWKPADIQEIDGELQNIKEAIPHVDEASKSALNETANTLQKERDRLKKLLPEGVQGMQAGTQSYAGNSFPFRQATTQTDRTINRNQVVNNMRKNLGVVIDTGRLVSPKRGTLGQFKINPGVIRTRMAEDLQVISHEVGHALDKRYKLQNNPEYRQELINLTNTTNPNHLKNYDPEEHYAEAIAEYFRTRLTDPQRAEQLAPNFTKYLESKLSPKDLKGLEATARDIDTWITQGEYNQAKGLIDFTSGSKKEGFSWNKFYSRFVDDLDPLRLAEKALKGAVGIGKESIYKMARLSRGIAQRAELAVKRGIYVDGKKVSDGLAEIVKPLEDIGMKEKDFATYLAVKHAQDLKAMGKMVPFDDPQMKAVLQKWDNNPVVQQAHKKIMQYNNALLDILKDAQILSDKAIQEMRQKYPNYVPFMRYFDDDAIAGFKNGGFGAAKGFANITNPIKRMTEEGSTRTIINPIESMVKNTFLVMNAAAKNKVGLQLMDLAKIDGAGAWVEHVGKGGASPHEHIISVYVNGERQAVKVRNPDLYNAMLSLDTESTNSLIRFLGGAASLLRAGATLTPDFMIRNALRDIVGNTVNATKYGFNPLTIFSGLFHMINRDTGVFNQFLSSGGAMGTLMSLDREANREALKSVFKASLADKAMNVVTSPKELIKLLTGITPLQKTVGILRKGSEISELATRVGAFNKVLKKTGSAEEAAYQARDLMDFNRAGSAIRPANKAIAFLNANIQGIDRMRRAFWGDGARDIQSKASFLVRAFTTLVMPAYLTYMWNKHLPEEEQKIYDNIPQWQKDSFFIIGIPGTGKFLRIPKPFEAGMLFATGTERVLRWIEEHDPEAFKGYASSVVQALTPPTMITALTPILEAITNYSFFRNAPIVPQGEQGLEKKDQYGLYTSETAKLIGSLMSHTPFKDSNAASPRIIDNTIKGYTAGLGQYAISGLDSIIRAVNGKNEIPQPAKSITERQPISSFMATTSGGGQIRQDFYDKWDELSKAEASAKKNGQPYTDPQYEVMKQGKKVIDELNKQYKAIQANPTMSPQEKRAKLDDLDNFMNEVARQSLGKK